MIAKISFLYVDIWFEVMKWKFIVTNNSFEMLVVFLPIFVADTKITFVYNFVAPLSLSKERCIIHCVKGVQLRSFSWSIFGHFSRSG